MSVTSLAMLQQTASSLRDIFDRISQKKSSLYENLHHIESLYNGQKVKNTTPDGRLPYPPPEEKEAATKKGMAISVRYVMSYITMGCATSRII